MAEKKLQREMDREATRVQLRKIIADEATHDRDLIAAAKLLRQLNTDEQSEEADDDQFDW